jgi:hypothetical protein
VADAPIDVWDVETFDPELAARLAAHADLMAAYHARANQIFLDHDYGHARTLIRPENKYAADFSALRESIGDLMAGRTIRAWHYTRLTDREVEALRRNGIHLSTPQSLRRRFDAIVAEGRLTKAEIEVLWAQKMFNHQHDSRAGKFWAVSHLQRIDDGGVEPLMKHWGGEAASMWMKEPALLETLEGVGRARVVAVAMPLDRCDHFRRRRPRCEGDLRQVTGRGLRDLRFRSLRPYRSPGRRGPGGQDRGRRQLRRPGPGIPGWLHRPRPDALEGAHWGGRLRTNHQPQRLAGPGPRTTRAWILFGGCSRHKPKVGREAAARGPQWTVRRWAISWAKWAIAAASRWKGT